MKTRRAQREMHRYDASTYGERIADVYDAVYQGYEDATIALLSDLAHGGRALELGIGTGRIALPLAAAGVDVHGIDASEPMVARLRAKSSGTSIPVTLGDFADVAVGGQFALIFVVLNTFTALNSQEEQVRCFCNVAQHLTDDGVFVVEAFVPDLSQFVRGQYTVASVVGTDRVGLDVARHDPVHQRTVHQHIDITEKGIQLYPVQLRYVWPAELDLMAQLAGMRLHRRWGGWQREPFTAASERHVSIYKRASGG
jgi:SAM-dependent methyltransferase